MTIVEILREQLTGKKIVVYKYEGHHIKADKTHAHYFAYKDEESDLNNPDIWKDVTWVSMGTKIIDVRGHSDPYEGDNICIIIKPFDKEITVDIGVDKEFEIV